ncbi:MULTISPECIES: GUN4 domain-containing protein [unclassified Microcystis]|jgi:hypothetical protein|uniref:GUN4 domain-containing protein n=1 Tax=Microcystis flos-aquae Mf_QC_C_20070823_S10D TaxID=2486236 RepID=A0A552L0F9_9CHRO|nr:MULTISPECIES: GUN4 domain-containing protein [unclassified Microcystis]MCA2817656.1 GUN4 domain-containing protein [Microcystis sp. M085S1]MCA2856867.1 GUN4 domain-containing protein [Microcystis sp. M065S1]TRT91262.1 MAG: GUN4 domain-containing protein [Microcystis flos-aquae Ma_QC_C_20070823_S18D]TRV13720.1 MAG: GUN4 domain-containing protein [Microcystis flos-aquae Mf_QC_C_20070823_S10D]TRV29084.1 MAG: GUN4 domain-containing protein [Microcystis flos-aquae Mf_QC_C_20070823_S10]TRV30107.
MTEETVLRSEKGINYTRLRDLLKACKWSEANGETINIFIRVCKTVDITEEDIDDFPCTDLLTIDRLWVRYSQGYFGFSTQMKMLQEIENREEFGNQVGWRMNDQWINSSKLRPDESAPIGHFPSIEIGVFMGDISDGKDWVSFSIQGSAMKIFSRIRACGLSKLLDIW